MAKWHHGPLVEVHDGDESEAEALQLRAEPDQEQYLPGPNITEKGF